jgi:urease gamma subunit/urease beta subunit
MGNRPVSERRGRDPERAVEGVGERGRNRVAETGDHLGDVLVESAGGSMAPTIAVATSSLVMVVNAAVATAATPRPILARLSHSRPLLLLLASGGVVGAALAVLAPAALISWGFVLYLAFTVIDVLARPGFLRPAPTTPSQSRALAIPAPLAAPIGVVASFLGVGASVMTVPLLRRSGLRMSEAATLANPLTLAISLPACLTFLIVNHSSGVRTALFSLGTVDLGAGLLLLLGAVPVVVLLRRKPPAIPDRAHAWGCLGLLVVVLVVATTELARDRASLPRMRLTPTERDRLLIFTAAELARARRARGLRLNVPEATALIADTVCEAARDGARLAEAMAAGREVLAAEDVLPGVADVVGQVEVEAVFDDGTRLVVVTELFQGTSMGHEAPGAVLPGSAEPVSFPGAVTITVTNTASVPISVTSHFHFFEVNPRLRFDRRVAYGRRLAVDAGGTVRFGPGDTRDVELTPIGGARVVIGFAGLVDGPLDAPGALEAALDKARACGYLGAE